MSENSKTVVAGEPRMLVDGRLVGARSGVVFANINPATEEVIGEVADGGPEDMDTAIAAARRAFDRSDWPRDRELRRRCLVQLQQALDREKDGLRMQTVAEAGAPLQLTYGPQGDTIIEDANWAIRMIDEYPWERTLPVRSFFGMTSRRVVLKEPVGVVGAITPWNYPLQVNIAKIVPALAAGNTVVLKPAPETPWNATFIARLAAEHTDIPAGVLNVVTSADRAALGRMLVADPRVDMISFTGSTATGRLVMTDAAANVKNVFLELGGKSAHVFLEDADLAATLPGASMVCVHAGQGCAMLTRVLLPRSRYEEGVAILKAALEAFPYGDPLDLANLMGPLISERQRERVLGYVKKGIAEGARLVCGGRAPAHLKRGYYVEPTLFADVDNGMTIAREEIFGPVLVAIPYRDEDDAVRIANDSIYGLSGAVTSASEDRAMAVARRLRTGTVGVNGGIWFGPDAPFGGYKQSGVGREMGIEGFEGYLETKTVALPA